MLTPKLGKYMGRVRDFHDSRDHVLRVPHMTREAVGDVDVFTPLCSLPSYDQEDESACTGNAGVRYRRWLAQRYPRFSKPDQELSRQFLYWMERALPWNNSTALDSGANTRDICIVLTKTGVCPEIDDPYLPSTLTTEPSPAAALDASQYKVGAYHRLPDVDTIISCLIGGEGYPALLGVTLYPSFEDIAADGVMPMPLRGEQPIGGHEMVIHGYSSERRAFRLQNSWSSLWGDRGHLWMPEAFLEDQDLSQFDSWMMHLGKPW
jgi:hypothetical protein